MYRFGECELDVAGRDLRRGGEPVHLEPQAFDLLVHLLEHREQVVSKAELLDGVWGHRFVSEANLTTRVKEARRAVGDDGARQSVIRNVRGRGYRFVAPVMVADHASPGLARARSVLFGRDAELAAIAERVAAGPLVTILGPGGVGKSTLARAVAAAVGSSFVDGDHVVELAALDAGADVALAVARALDVVMDSGRPDDAVRSIARLRALLVLDNCEHVADEVAGLVSRVLSASEPNLRILATSQVRLGLSGEQVVAVGPLAVPDAMALFIERVRAVVPGWTSDAVGDERLEQLVSRLDRLPLTIEMSATRLSSMRFEDLEASIADGGSLHRMSHRTPARRHRSLESVVAWSTDLLDADHRRLFRDFSVFAGRVTVADAGAVVAAGDPAGARFDLASLAERSLLVADVDGTDTRYSMLTTMRAVAERWLEESGTADALRRRHAEHIRDVLRDVDDQLRTPAEPEGRLRLAGVIDEARAAFRWAGSRDLDLTSDLGAALHLATYPTIWLEPAEWCRELPGRPAADSCGVALLSAAAAIHQGELDAARQLASDVAGVSNGRLRAIAEELLGDVALYVPDADAALDAARELRRLGDELGDAHVLAFAAVDSALARALCGDPRGALDDLERADLPPLAPTDAAWVAYARGDAMSLDGDRGAADEFREAIELGSSVGSRHVVSLSRTFLAIEYTRIGEYELALDAFADAVHDFRRHGNYTDATTTVRWLAELLAVIGDDRAATILGAVTEGYGSGTGSSGRVDRLLGDIRTRVGHSRFETWADEGRGLPLDDALRAAAEFVDTHRR